MTIELSILLHEELFYSISLYEITKEYLKRQDAWPPTRRPGFDPWRQKMEIFLLLRVHPGPRTKSASCKMSTKILRGVKMAERRANHPTSS